MTIENDTKGPAVKIPPPLVFAGFMLLAVLLQRFWRLSLPQSLLAEIIGVLLILAGLVAGLMIKRGFDKAHTSIEPWKPTSTIIKDGFFKYSRNPIYVAFCVIVIGAALFIGNAWMLFSYLPAAVTVYFVAIKNEEAYLEEKFGEEYLAYKRQVRRWL